MSNIPLVSVIMPAYNAEKYIGEAIQSVINQTWNNWELIVVDDGSTDNTLQIAKKYAKIDSRIYVCNQPNQGPSAARNYALNKVQGDYIQYLDADDILHCEKLSKHICLIQQKEIKDDVLTYGICYNLTNEMSIIKTPMHSLFQDYSHSLDAQVEILENHFISFPYSTYLIPTSLLQNIGDWEVNLNRAEDSEYMARLLANVSSLCFIPDSIFYYRVVDNSLSRRNLTENQLKSELIVANKISDLILQNINTQKAKHACEIHYTDVLTAWYPQNQFLVKDILKSMKKRGLQLNFENRGYLFHGLRRLFGWRVAVIIMKWKNKIS